MAGSGANRMEFISFDEARELVLQNMPLLGASEVDSIKSAGFVTAADIAAKVSSPSVDTSLMDGFAVNSGTTSGASDEKPVRLRIAAEIAAGGQGGSVGDGECARIFTGAPLPDGADTVVPIEECEEKGGGIAITSPVNPGSHVQPGGEDFREGDIILKEGSLVTPGAVGLLVSAGAGRVDVVSRPRVEIVAVGDELVEQGSRLERQQRYASNLFIIKAWLSRFGIENETGIARDDAGEIAGLLTEAVERADAVVTTGGVGGSARDLVPGALDSLGWEKIFYGVKMRPGKGTAFGLLNDKPVFCLPGGPTSCEAAFLELALPGLLRMTGRPQEPFHAVTATLSESLKAAPAGWIRFVFGIYSPESGGGISVKPLLGRSRLKSSAQATCVIVVPTDSTELGEQQKIVIQVVDR